MVINFRIYEINRDTYKINKIVWMTTLIKKKKKEEKKDA
jgi:hypothetical protein